MRTIAQIALVVCIAAYAVQAETRMVPSDYTTIQNAIDASQSGDVVVVGPGVYFERINFKGKDITVTSTDPDSAGIVGYTVLNAEQNGSAVVFASGETSQAVLTGFTITGGTGTYSSGMTSVVGVRTLMGAGVCCLNASPTITKNVIVRNTGEFNITGPTDADVVITCGGAIGAYNCSPTITHNTIRTNSAYAGGGIMSYFGQPTISNNMIYENASYIGGGIFTLAGSIYNNTVNKNDCSLSSGDGAGGNLYVVFEPSLGNTQVFNNIFTNAPSGGGIYWEGDVSLGVFAYNNVWGNAGGNYYNGDQTGQAGNISENPLFRSVLGRDFHLTLESPCVNTGDPSFVPSANETDIDGDVRVYANRVDMGADEYVGYIKPVANAGHDTHVLEPLTAVSLDGTGSFFYDPMSVRTYQWKQVSGPNGVLDNPDSATPIFTPQAEGLHVLELVVADDKYASEPDQVVVYVGPNHEPIADAGPDKAWRSPGLVTLDGSRSYDPDPAENLSYSWIQTAGPAVALDRADTVAPTFMAQPGERYSFELVVSDGFAQSAPSEVTIVAVEVSLQLRGLNTYDLNFNASNYPDVSGTRAVFVTGSSAYQWRVTYRDFMIDETETFSIGGASMHPKIDGDLVVWSGGPTAPSANGLECTSVFLRNLASGTQTTLRALSTSQSFSHPAVSGDIVVWVQHANVNKNIPSEWTNTPYDICGADVTDIQHPAYFTIAQAVGRRDPFPYQNPVADVDRVVDISGNLVVWEGDGDIYAADISDLSAIKVFPVCQAAGRQYDPAVSGNYVVWTDQRDDSGDVYGADISDPQNVRVFEVAKAKGTQQQPAITGCLVAYVEGSMSGWIKVACITARCGILDVDLSTSLAGLTPAFDGTTLVWMSGSYGLAQGVRIGFGYSAVDGQVQNQTSGKRYDYVQHAIACAEPGDEIVVPPGIHQENIDFLDKSVTVRSTDPNDPVVVAATVLQGHGNLATFTGGQTEACVLDGLTIAGGYQGVYCYESGPTIHNCMIANHRGAGMRAVSQSKPFLTRCRIVGNAGDGIDMHADTNVRSLTYNVPTLTNCIVAGNRQMGIRGGQPVLTNCTVVENLKEGVNSTTAAVSNCIVYSNGVAQIVVSTRSSVSYSDVQGGQAGAGNINADPLFVRPGVWTEAAWVEGDYHLKSQGWRWDVQTGSWVSDDVTSPCIDAGSPSSPLFDEPLAIPGVAEGSVVNTRIDMGAYGGTSQASVKRADLQ
jgi:beta propeller repeat protein